jgi:Zn-dependent oligopeptidase
LEDNSAFEFTSCITNRQVRVLLNDKSENHANVDLDTILSQGGSVDPMQAFINFRGRAPDIGPLLRLHGIAA